MKTFKSFVGITLLASAITGFAQEEAVDALATTTILAQEGVPGGLIINTLELEAKVVAIDQATRSVVVQIPSGATKTFTAGAEVINFDQIQVGDMIRAMATEELIIHMAGEGSENENGAAVAAILAPKGSKPGAIAAEIVRATATVTAIDSEARTATLESEDGSTTTVSVRPDIDLSLHKVGEKVVFEMTQMIALSVEKVTE